MKNSSFFLLLPLTIVLLFFSHCEKKPTQEIWPTPTAVNKPWTRWWWMGNAVNKSQIRKSMVAFQKAGLGGVEIASIYGVKGAEADFIDHLSPQWMEQLAFTLKMGDSLSMGVDLTLGTGWPFGGPQVSVEHAATKLFVKQSNIKAGNPLNEDITHRKEGLSEPLRNVAAVAFSKSGKYTDLSPQLQHQTLRWEAQQEDYQLILLYEDKTLQKVKRASPGGAGWTVDHFSSKALEEYLIPYTAAFEVNQASPRSIFNDSYEVYNTNFTADFLNAFESRRGYDLKPHLQQLLLQESDPIGNRIKADYRATISDLLLEEFQNPWNDWAHERNMKTRLQAHGSPGNLIDLYASADIPECETFGSMPFDVKGLRRLEANIRPGDADPAMLRFSASAAHISGKPLVSSESFTWLREHFKTALSQCKPEVEDLFLNGVNHVFLHGSTFSPDTAAWPGWKFYASVNFNPTNTFWADVPELFGYITRIQSFLQAGSSDNDVLLYWPIHDVWGNFLDGRLMQQLAIHDLDTWLKNTPFYEAIQTLLAQGHSFDYLSDQFLLKATVQDGQIQLPGGRYKALIVPNSTHMPLGSLEQLLALKAQGANILFEGTPETVPGWFEYEKQTAELEALLSKQNIPLSARTDWNEILASKGIIAEAFPQKNLKFIRRNYGSSKVYFVVNHKAEAVKDWVPLRSNEDHILLLDPLTGAYGVPAQRTVQGNKEIFLQLDSGQSLLIQTGGELNPQQWNYRQAGAPTIKLNGSWELTPLSGGPTLPQTVHIDRLSSWTDLGKTYEDFSGTVSYKTTFTLPNNSKKAWRLTLGDVRESAAVYIDGKYYGTVWANPMYLDLPFLEGGAHDLELRVTNLGANRIRAKEKRGEDWTIFYEINMVNKDYKAWDASVWELTPSGLIQAPELQPLNNIIP